MGMDDWIPEDTGWVTEPGSEHHDPGWERDLSTFQRGYVLGMWDGRASMRAEIAAAEARSRRFVSERRKARRIEAIGAVFAGIVAYPGAWIVGAVYGATPALITWFLGTLIGIPLVVIAETKIKNA